LTDQDFGARLASVGQEVETVLAQLLDASPLPGEIARPDRLLAAMRHATLAGGKRLRPFLVIEAARLGGVEGPHVVRAAASIECIHCYSLVHDDLPAMDDDDLRRGRPTTHRAFDEATAILAGDALMTIAFDILAEEATDPDPRIRIALVGTLARAAGLGGMAGGQMLDLEAEGRFASDARPLPLSDTEILRLQAMKTGALLTAAVEMGAIIGKADRGGREALRQYGNLLGQAFQIADDILDVEADAQTLGKATGKDQTKGKATLVGLWGVEAARERLDRLVHEAEAALAGFGVKGTILRQAARFVAQRRN